MEDACHAWESLLRPWNLLADANAEFNMFEKRIWILFEKVIEILALKSCDLRKSSFTSPFN